MYIVKLRYIAILFFAVALSLEASAQRRMRRVNKVDTLSLVRAYIDSIPLLQARIDSLVRANDSLTAVKSDGRYYRLFAPLTFYHSPAAKAFGSFDAVDGGDDVVDAVDAALLNVYIDKPWLVKSNESKLKKTGTLLTDIDTPIRQEIKLADKADYLIDEPDGVPVGVMIKRPNFWTFSGEQNLQFMQNYLSENWYKGGESNYSLVANVVMNANYNNKQRLKFDNKLELKLGFQTSRSDTLHKFKANSDLIRYTGKLGIQAVNRWYYTLQVLAYTQFTQGLKANDKKVYSDFMSPFTLNIGVGMDYTVETKNKRLKGNVNMSVLSFNFKYVDRKSLNSRNGITGNHHTGEDFGSQLTTNITWTINDMIRWQTRLYCFTTYKRYLMEWENTFTLKVSKYISANIFIYPRFDDSTKRDDDWNYWQFKEYSSLGFSYSF